MNDQHIAGLVKEADPVRRLGDSPQGWTDVRAETDLARIIADTGPRRPPYRRVVAVGAVAALSTAVLVVQPWSGDPNSASAATPPMLQYTVMDHRTARVQLLDFAKRVRALPAEPPGGPVLELQTKGWYLGASEDGTTTIDPQESVKYIQNGQIHYKSDSGWENPSMAYWPDGVSSNPRTLRQQLNKAHPGGGTSRLLDAIKDLANEANPNPGVRAAILTLLADVPGMTADGTTVDRSGRKAISYSVMDSGGGLPTRRSFLFNPKTGVLLDTEDVLTTDPGKLKIKLPAVIDYTVFISHTYLPALPR
jgi:hypothetical protein